VIGKLNTDLSITQSQNLSWEYSTAYNGKKSSTKSGKECVNWKKVRNALPLPHGSWNHNFCRNPDFHHAGPWCYTSKYSAAWEECGVEHCSSCSNNQVVENTSDNAEIINENVKCGIVERDPSMNLVPGDHKIDEFARQGVARGRLNSDNRSMPQPDRFPENSTSATELQGILSGRKAMRQTLPWQVLIRGRNLCGGTLVSMKHIISGKAFFNSPFS